MFGLQTWFTLTMLLQDLLHMWHLCWYSIEIMELPMCPAQSCNDLKAEGTLIFILSSCSMKYKSSLSLWHAHYFLLAVFKNFKTVWNTKKYWDLHLLLLGLLTLLEWVCSSWQSPSVPLEASCHQAQGRYIILQQTVKDISIISSKIRETSPTSYVIPNKCKSLHLQNVGSF